MRLINLKTKIILIVFILILIFIFGSVLLIYFSIKADYDSLEKEELKQRLTMASNLIGADAKNLETIVRDYAVWDDTYDFVANNNPEYLNNNFTNYSLNSLKISLVLINNKSGEAIYQNYLNYNTSTQYLFLDRLKTDFLTAQKRFKDSNEEYSINGLVDSPDGLMMVGVNTIRDSLNSKPVNGSLIFGRVLDKIQVEKYSRHINLPLKLIAYNPSNLEKGLSEVKNGLITQNVVYIKKNNQFYIYGLLYDINGKPITIIEIQSNLNFAAKNFRSIARLLVGLFLVSLLFGGFLVIVLYFIFIKRIDNLNKKLKSINLKKDELIDSRMMFRDEMGDLAGNINKIINYFKVKQSEL